MYSKMFLDLHPLETFYITLFYIKQNQYESEVNKKVFLNMNNIILEYMEYYNTCR